MMYKLPSQIVIHSARKKGSHKFARVFPQSTVAFAQLCFIFGEDELDFARIALPVFFFF